MSLVKLFANPEIIHPSQKLLIGSKAAKEVASILMRCGFKSKNIITTDISYPRDAFTLNRSKSTLHIHPPRKLDDIEPLFNLKIQLKRQLFAKFNGFKGKHTFHDRLGRSLIDGPTTLLETKINPFLNKLLGTSTSFIEEGNILFLNDKNHLFKAIIGDDLLLLNRTIYPELDDTTIINNISKDLGILSDNIYVVPQPAFYHLDMCCFSPKPGTITINKEFHDQTENLFEPPFSNALIDQGFDLLYQKGISKNMNLFNHIIFKDGQDNSHIIFLGFPSTLYNDLIYSEFTAVLKQEIGDFQAHQLSLKTSKYLLERSAGLRCITRNIYTH